MAEAELDQVNINISDKAATEIKKAMAENKVPMDFGLRMGVKGGGCSGFTYVLGFDENPRDFDKIINSNGVKVFVDEKSIPYLSGVILDYEDSLNGKGFTFANPNASRTCGCGHSFSV